LPETWGEPVNGLALGVIVSSDEHSILFEVHLKNVSPDSISLVRESLKAAPRFEFAYSAASMYRLVCRPATLSLASPLICHAGTPLKETELPAGKSRLLGRYVVGPRSDILRLGVPRAVAKTEVQVAAPGPPAEKEGQASTVEIASNTVSIPPTQKEEQERQIQESFQCQIISLLRKHPDWPLDQVLVTIASNKRAKLLVRGCATSSLAKLKTPRSIAALMELAGDATDALQPSVVLHLGRAGDPCAVPLLKQLCGDERSKIRAHAAAGLGPLGAMDAVPLLVGLLHHDSAASVRENAGRSLGQLGGRQAVDALHRALEEEQHHNVLYNIIIALERSKERSSVRPLLEFLKNSAPPEAIGRSMAAKAIDTITGQEFEGDIEKIARWLEVD